MEVKVLDEERYKKRLPISEIASVEDSQDTVWTHRVMRLPKVEEKTSSSFALKTVFLRIVFRLYVSLYDLENAQGLSPEIRSHVHD
jgi:hypothetical protein